MCGIAGIYSKKGHAVNKEIINQMLEEIQHRGPDNHGVYLNENIAIGHRLLKIQDLSDMAFQPIYGEKFIMSFNGEIYNYQKLRTILKRENIEIKSSGDTEVLIKCFETWGLDKTLEVIDGCYAIALFEKKEKNLYLIRDRVGIKPLYYYYDDDKLVFGSEIKSILKDKNIRRQMDIKTILLSFVCKLWMPHEDTMFDSIKMLEQGTYLKMDEQGTLTKKIYYQHEFHKDNVVTKEIISEVKDALVESVNKKLLSKVPIAAFLSGGIDSSLICKIANDNLDKSLNVYTVWYEDKEDPDYLCSKVLAEKEKMIHHKTLIKPENYSIHELDKVIYCVEELLIDKVYLSVYENYRHAKEDGFTVILNGQGADECWLGYLDNWHIYDYSYLSDDCIITNLIDDYYMNNYLFLGKLKKEFEQQIKENLKDYLEKNLMRYKKDEILNRMQMMSLRTILHDLLMQEDKLAMAHSVESRVPFVDSNKMLELALSIDGKIKILDGREKYILRSAGKEILPSSIINRKKMPFQEPPINYNNYILDIFDDNVVRIKESKIIKFLFDDYWIENIALFNEQEKWWIINLWRFEEIFEMEV